MKKNKKQKFENSNQNPEFEIPANHNSASIYQQITKYQLMMSTKQDPKPKRQRKNKEIQASQQPIATHTVQKVQIQALKTPFLRDLSPFSPIYHTVKKSYDYNVPNCDLAIIETPLHAQRPKSLIQEVEGRYNMISKLLVWQQEEQQANNSGSGDMSGSSISDSNEENRQQIRNQDNSANKISDMQVRVQSQILQKAGQKIKNPKVLKKIKQKGLKLEASASKRKVTCNCKKTKCLKLYCDCFHENQVCGPQCNCVGCHNTDQHQQQRYNSMLSLMQRNPEAFRPRLQQQQHAKGCNCKKSGCLKKYCECYQAGLGCGEHCKCQDCKNSKNVQQSVGKQKQKESMDIQNGEKQENSQK